MTNVEAIKNKRVLRTLLSKLSDKLNEAYEAAEAFEKACMRASLEEWINTDSSEENKPKPKMQCPPPKR